MSARIDHAARAAGALTEETRYQFAKIDALAESLTHAVLALVEQQRIANLIALASQDAHLGPNPAGSARRILIELVKDPEDGEYMHYFRPDIAAALGIGAES